MTNTELRCDWTESEIESIYNLPLPELIYRAQSAHRIYHATDEVQSCALLSIKTGGCPEDCAYCPQSAHYNAGVTRDGLMSLDDTLSAARRARQNGVTRFCMGAAWRGPKARDLAPVLDMVREVKALGLETCCTLGMLKDGQAELLRDAGLDYYNHNLDTSPDFYASIISTRDYADRLDTLERVRGAGLKVCCGGIVGLGETREARAGLLAQLASLDPQPESVPINDLVQVEGTPLAGAEKLPWVEFVRTIAVARILMPASVVRLSAGRAAMSDAVQALCFFAGANSIFYGDKLLTTGNPDVARDDALFAALGLESA